MIYLSLIFSGLFLGNILLNSLLGLPLFDSKTNSLKGPAQTGVFSLIISLLSAVVLYPVYHYVLKPIGIDFLYMIISVVVVSYVSLGVRFIAKQGGIEGVSDKHALLIPANAFIIGLSILVLNNTSYIEALVQVLGLALGYFLVLLMIYAIKPRLDLGVPKSFKGLPILLITLALIAMAFMGLAGIL